MSNAVFRSWLRGSAALVVACVVGACAGSASLGPSGDGGMGDEPPVRTGPYDECGNGFDDDGDGMIDEGCFCAPDETQSCFTGTLNSRDVGACSDGLQRCQMEGTAEFGTWGACEQDQVAVAELCDGEVDDDCDGAIDEACPCTVGESRDCGVEFLLPPCSGGTQVCREDGTWSGCEGAISPEPES